MNWTKFSEKLPEESVEAVYVITAAGRLVVWLRNNTPNNSWADYSSEPLHWHPIIYPELPPREETQHEKDRAAYRAWVHKGEWAFSPQHSWHMALQWERAEVAKLVSQIHPKPYPEVGQTMAILRRRCGLDK